jgi:hypothetical protein
MHVCNLMYKIMIPVYLYSVVIYQFQKDNLKQYIFILINSSKKYHVPVSPTEAY